MPYKTALDAFDMMVQGCFYCGEFAITLDRSDSNLIHTRDNCVVCCDFCNRSKGAIDPKTFILQAVYRRTFIYYDDKDIWYDTTNKSRWDQAKGRVLAQNRHFDLHKDQYIEYCTDKCHYCQRMPPKGKFFGVVKIDPDNGYVVRNCVTACASCTRAKWDYSTEEFTLRDERITQRYLEGYFDDMPIVSKNMFFRCKL
jgi:5-methylcytosine-specific restriction endonuclease McrA